MPHSTRRHFLKLAAAASLAASHAGSLWGRPPSRVQSWVTSKDRRMQEVEIAGWHPIPKSATAGIRIDASKRLQEILGFGGAFTDASCYLFSQLAAEKRQVLLGELYGQNGLRLSVGRTCIGASDYSRFAYSFDESPDPDPELQRFTIDHDRECILPVLLETQKLNPDLYLFSCPWSPPSWMKANDSHGSEDNQGAASRQRKMN